MVEQTELRDIPFPLPVHFSSVPLWRHQQAQTLVDSESYLVGNTGNIPVDRMALD
jgi:hypothetical protein